MVKFGKGSLNSRNMQRRLIKCLKLALLSLLTTLAIGILLTPFRSDVYHAVLAQIGAEPSVALGVYDPAGDFDQSESVLIDHQFVTWRLDNANELLAALDHAKQTNRLPMITLESWPWEWNGMVRETLLQDIIAGKYDSTLEYVSQALKDEAPQIILMRWGHEMEMVDQYPWWTNNAEEYIAAYQHIVNYFRSREVSNLLWIWSPAGNKEAKAYWPGEDYVDYVGVSIYGEKAWNYRDRNKIPSFRRLMSEKYWPVRRYGKPMIVSEVGVAGTEEEKSQWITDAINTLRKFPQIKAWVYFNQVQPDIVPLSIGQPHWELSQHLAQQLLRNWQTFNKGRLSTQNIDEFLSIRPHESK